MSKQEPKFLLNTPIVKVEFEIAKWAVDFIQDYLKFLGSSWTVEDLARDAFFQEACAIRDTLLEMHHQDKNDFPKKYSEVYFLDSREEQKHIEELESRNP